MKSTKKTLIATVVFFNSMIVCAQDTLILKNNTQQVGFVFEITPTEIKYKKLKDTENPIYIVNKSDVTKIHYYNGTIDVFETVHNKQPLFRLNRSGKIFENNVSISENKMYRVVLTAEDPKIDLHIKNSKIFRTVQYTSFGLGFASIVYGALSGLNVSSRSEQTQIEILTLAGAGACFTTSLYSKYKRNKNNKDAIKRYNQLITN